MNKKEYDFQLDILRKYLLEIEEKINDLKENYIKSSHLKIGDRVCVTTGLIVNYGIVLGIYINRNNDIKYQIAKIKKDGTTEKHPVSVYADSVIKKVII